MKQQQKQFILRQIQYLSEQGDEPKNILESVLSQTMSTEAFNRTMAQFRNSQSLIKTLCDCDILNIDKESLNHLLTLEKQDQRIPFFLLSEADRMISNTFQQLRVKLSAALTYAAALLATATIVFYIIAENVLVQFADIYNSFGADMPELTKMALAWQNSWLPPYILSFAILLVLIYIAYKMKNLTTDIFAVGFLNKIPFIQPVFELTRLLRWLNHLKILVAMNNPIDGYISNSSEYTKQLNRHLPGALDELIMAQKLGTANQEIDFQIGSLVRSAETLISNSSRKFVAAIMTAIICYIGFILVATYTPIFQLGSAI